MRDAFSDRKLLRRSLNFISDSILQITWRFANLGSGSTHILNKSQALLLRCAYAPPIFFSLFLFLNICWSPTLKSFFFILSLISGTAVCFLFFGCSSIYTASAKQIASSCFSICINCHHCRLYVYYDPS